MPKYSLFLREAGNRHYYFHMQDDDLEKVRREVEQLKDFSTVKYNAYQIVKVETIQEGNL